MLTMRSMASGDPVDLQWDKRWPNHTGNTQARGVKVQFHLWEEDSDYSDQEGIAPLEDGYDPVTGLLQRKSDSEIP